MPVLKTISPKVSPSAPNVIPRKAVPSSRTRTAGAPGPAGPPDQGPGHQASFPSRTVGVPRRNVATTRPGSSIPRTGCSGSGRRARAGPPCRAPTGRRASGWRAARHPVHAPGRAARRCGPGAGPSGQPPRPSRAGRCRPWPPALRAAPFPGRSCRTRPCPTRFPCPPPDAARGRWPRSRWCRRPGPRAAPPHPPGYAAAG